MISMLEWWERGLAEGQEPGYFVTYPDIVVDIPFPFTMQEYWDFWGVHYYAHHMALDLI